MYGNGRDDNDYGRYPRVGISEDRCVYGRRDDCDAVALKFRGRRDDRYRERYDRFLRACAWLFADARPDRASVRPAFFTTMKSRG